MRSTPGRAVALGERALLTANTVATPVGPLTVLETGDTLVAAGFAPMDVLLRSLVRPGEQQRAVVAGPPGAAWAALVDYLDGDLDALGALSVARPSSRFRHAIQTALREIPPGQTISYTELAGRAGNPLAARAAAAACAANPIAVVVPCHRVVARSGALHGYRYGLEIKAWLLAHERVVTGPDCAVAARR